MSVSMTAAEYVDYLKLAAEVIQTNRDYVTELDSRTGDGDHWVNLNMGFRKVVSLEAELKAMPLPDMLKKVGMTLMASIGGSSGVL
ncbi:MAG: DAK2 domain-containing protein, partial [Lawsonibacter sp.]|nr:DAK2 domain-containing protein [Lawsonibacter sp.]